MLEKRIWRRIIILDSSWIYALWVKLSTENKCHNIVLPFSFVMKIYANFKTKKRTSELSFSYFNDNVNFNCYISLSQDQIDYLIWYYVT